MSVRAACMTEVDHPGFWKEAVWEFKSEAPRNWTYVSEHELTFTFAICCRLCVCLSSVCNARAPYSQTRRSAVWIRCDLWKSICDHCGLCFVL